MIFGGKNLYLNFMVGGVLCVINLDGMGFLGVLVNMISLNFVLECICEVEVFIKNVYILDVIVIVMFYKDWLYGGGLVVLNVLCYGIYIVVLGDKFIDLLLVGVIINGNWDEVYLVDVCDLNEIQEFVDYSWYQYVNGVKGLYLWDGEIEVKFELGLNFKGIKMNIKELDESVKYSWIKVFCWKGYVMEVGLLVCYIVVYVLGKEYVQDQVDCLLLVFNQVIGMDLGFK